MVGVCIVLEELLLDEGRRSEEISDGVVGERSGAEVVRDAEMENLALSRVCKTGT